MLTASVDSPCRKSTTSKSSTSVSASRRKMRARSRPRSAAVLFSSGTKVVLGPSVTQHPPPIHHFGRDFLNRAPGSEGMSAQPGQRVRGGYVQLHRQHPGRVMHDQPIRATGLQQPPELVRAVAVLQGEQRVRGDVGGAVTVPQAVL